MYRRLIRGLVLAALLLLPTMVAASGPVRQVAAQSGLTIQLEPEGGPPGTTVEIYGISAPSRARVNVFFAPFTDLGNCQAGGSATLVGEAIADEGGRFVIEHFPEQTGGAVGLNYFARIAGSQTTSNVACFVFTEGQATRFFPQTGKWVRGEFLRYWQERGALEIFGYPLTTEFIENGRITQYFERAVFALHPENQRPWNVLLRLLGAELTVSRWAEAPFQRTPRQNNADCIYFEETGHNVCGNFRRYWNDFGGLPVYGYPVSEAFQERVAETGQIYTVQYFQRERFELHPGAWPQRHDVLLGRLGAQVLPGGDVGQPFARIELPAEGSRHTLPLRMQIRTSQAGEELTIELRWQDGTRWERKYTTIQGEDGRGLLIAGWDFDVEGVPPMPPTQPATLEVRDATGRVLTQRTITMIGFNDPESQQLQVTWILPFDEQVFRSVPVRVPRTTSVGAAALEALLWGPDPGNLAGFITAIPTPEEVLAYHGREEDWGPRVTLLGLTIENGIATANFSQEMRAYGGGAARVEAIREQITRTLRQFPTVTAVRIAIEGQTEGVLQP